MTNGLAAAGVSAAAKPMLTTDSACHQLRVNVPKKVKTHLRSLQVPKCVFWGVTVVQVAN